MKKEKNYSANVIAILLLIMLMMSCSHTASKIPIKRTELQRHNLSVPGLESIQAIIDFEPGTEFGMHSHPGEEIIYVLEGSFEYEVEGKPPQTLTTGGVLFIPSGKNHSAKNNGTTHAAELATYIVEKNKPLISMIK